MNKNENEKSRWLAKDFNILKGELLEIGISEISITIVVLCNFIYDDGEDPPMMYSCYKGDTKRKKETAVDATEPTYAIRIYCH